MDPMESKHRMVVWCVGLACWAALGIARAKSGVTTEPFVKVDLADKKKAS